MCAIRINSNLESLKAQRQASAATEQVGRALERLSSGMRINRASDDAAGLAISSQLKSDVRVFSQALRNASDGISVSNLASSALDSLSGINIRMRELAQQAGNGAYSSSNRRSLDQEFQQLIEEHNRIVNSAEFNGIRVFQNSGSSFQLQIGRDSSAMSTLSLNVARQLARTVGDASFSATGSVTSGSSPVTLVSGDLNQDGRGDVISANSGSGNLSIFLGQLDGSLGAANNVAITSTPSDLTISDFNGDGILDLASADSAGGAGSAISILTGTGSGTFTPGVTLSSGTGTYAITSGDVNNDGRIDLVASTTGSIAGASANFSSGSVETYSVTTPAASTAAAAEITDVTIIGTARQEVTQITAATALQGGTAESSTLTTTAASAFESDTFNFVSAGAQISGGNYWTFSSPSTNYYVWYTVNGSGSDPTPGGTGIQVDILNTDSDVDIATKTAEALETAVGDGGSGGGGGAALGSFTSYSYTGGSGGESPIATFDFNADGALDLIVNDYTFDSTASILFGNGDGSFKAEVEIRDFYTHAQYGFTDVNGDSKQDILSIHNGGYSVALGNGNGSFKYAPAVFEGWTYLTTNDDASKFYGDINGDSKVDLLVNDIGYLKAVFGNGNGTFNAGISLLAFGGPISSLVDINGDSKLDVLGSFQMLIGNGNGTFDVIDSPWTTDSSNGLEVADINGDGKLDVIQSSYSSNDIQIFLGNGNGSFSPGQSFGTLISPYAAKMTVGDFTGDGELDLALTDYDSGTGFVSVFSGNGNGTFNASTSFAAGASALSGPVAGDFDGDGDDDLAVSTQNGNPVLVALGNDSGGGPAPNLFDVTRTGGSVTIAGKTLGNATNATIGTMHNGGSFTITDHENGSTAIAPGSYFLLSSTSTDYYAWFSYSTSGGSNPNVAGRTGINIVLAEGDDADAVATKIAAALSPLGFSTSAIGDEVTITNAATGAATDIAAGTSGLGVAVDTQGAAGSGAIEAGDFFTISASDGSATTTFNVWFRVDGAGSGPSNGNTNLQVNITSSDSSTDVATAIDAALEGTGLFSSSQAGDVLTVTNTYGAAVTDAASSSIAAPFAVSTQTQGTSAGVLTSDETYFTFDTPSGNYYVWLNIGGNGVDPAIGGRTRIEVQPGWNVSGSSLASSIMGAINGATGDATASTVGSTLRITNTDPGAVSDVNGAGFLSSTTITQGSNGSASFASGSYFLLSSPTTDYYAWYNVDGGGGDPAVGGRTGIEIAISSGFSATQVASATSAAIDALADFAASASLGTVSITNAATGNVTNVSNGNVSGLSVNVTSQGVNSAMNVGADSITLSSHGLDTGDEVTFSTAGTLPGGIAASTTYYVIRDDANTFRIASSAIDAGLGTALDITSNGSGTHTVTGAAATGVPGTRVFLGEGNGQFSALSFSATDESITDMALGDLNGDGNQDMFGIDTASGVVLTRLGTGSGSFGTVTTYATGLNPRSLAVADLDNDGLSDVVTADSGSNELSVFFGQRDGSLSTRAAISTGATPYSIALGDINGDGAPDILATYDGAAATGIFINDRSGGFSAAAPVAAGANPRASAFGDINGDSVLDIITASSSSNEIEVAVAGTTTTAELALMNLRTQAAALEALDELSIVQARILSQQGDIGAQESRLNSVQSLLASIRESYTTAESRIGDADTAQESASLVRATILQQSAQRVLGLANLQPEMVLGLLSGI